MCHPFPRLALLAVFSFPCFAIGQDLNFTPNGSHTLGMSWADSTGMEFESFLIGSRDPRASEIQTLGPASRLDLKAPGKATREYGLGYVLLLKKDLDAATLHLKKSIEIYPNYVSAHNALGTAYLMRAENEEAKSEFAQAVMLDDHLPNSHLNLGLTHLALKEYPQAEESLRAAASIAPLDLKLQVALTYAEYKNKDYSAVLATSRHVHEKPHQGAAAVHLYAAAAWQAQGHLSEAHSEMDTLLKEDPHSQSAAIYGQFLAQIEAEQARRAENALHPATVFALQTPREPNPEELARRRQYARQQDEEARQVAEAETAPEPGCMECDSAPSTEISNARSAEARSEPTASRESAATFRISADEVSVFFTATDHGKPVTDLAISDLRILDDRQSPSAILGFRNESQLPLRLGLVIDISGSVEKRFSFEQKAASRFLREVADGDDDLAFVVGVSNSVLVVQDFTADRALTSRAVYQLAPMGGTALWDAVALAADKLADRPETQPVARILVVISDGEDNSSSMTLKQAIASAQRGEVAVYTVDSRNTLLQDTETVGHHALKVLSELTGGAAFKPDSIGDLGRILVELQKVIRGRYMVSYRPASFQRDGRYRTIDLAAKKHDRKLKVVARKGYYASAATSNLANR